MKRYDEEDRKQEYQKPEKSEWDFVCDISAIDAMKGVTFPYLMIMAKNDPHKYGSQKVGLHLKKCSHVMDGHQIPVTVWGQCCVRTFMSWLCKKDTLYKTQYVPLLTWLSVLNMPELKAKVLDRIEKYMDPFDYYSRIEQFKTCDESHVSAYGLALCTVAQNLNNKEFSRLKEKLQQYPTCAIHHKIMESTSTLELLIMLEKVGLIGCNNYKWLIGCLQDINDTLAERLQQDWCKYK